MVRLDLFGLAEYVLQLLLAEHLYSGLDSLLRLEFLLDQLQLMVLLLVLDPLDQLLVLPFESLGPLLQVLVVDLLHLERDCRFLEGFFRVFQGVIDRHAHRTHALNPVDVLDDRRLLRVALHLLLHDLADGGRHVLLLALALAPGVRLLEDRVLHQALPELLVRVILLIVRKDVREVIFECVQFEGESIRMLSLLVQALAHELEELQRFVMLIDQSEELYVLRLINDEHFGELLGHSVEEVADFVGLAGDLGQRSLHLVLKVIEIGVPELD